MYGRSRAPEGSCNKGYFRHSRCSLSCEAVDQHDPLPGMRRQAQRCAERDL